ncbi:hypothetical protein OAG62_00955, partial [bacterium]|nr:hypothetical protein [bacterium]
IDRAGRPKPAWWAARAACVPRLLGFTASDEGIAVGIVNDGASPWSADAIVRRVDVAGRDLAVDRIRLNAEVGASSQIPVSREIVIPTDPSSEFLIVESEARRAFWFYGKDAWLSLPAAAQALSKNIVVVDSGSTDGTIEHCRRHGVETIHRDWTTMKEQIEFVMTFCGEASWGLVLDSDEVVTDELASDIQRAIVDAGPNDTGFEMNRVNWLHGRPLRHALQPEWRLRLVRLDLAVVESDAAGVHYRFELTSGRSRRLQGPLRHAPGGLAGRRL